MEIAYKLVIKNRNDDDEYYPIYSYSFRSCSNNKKWDLGYDIGKITTPKIGKIFVFKNFPSYHQVSKIVSIRFEGWKLFKCLVDSLKLVEILSTNDDIESFWKDYESDMYFLHNPYNRYYYETPIKDTHYCNQCCLVQDVTDKIH